MHKVKRNLAQKLLEEKNNEINKIDVIQIDVDTEWKKFSRTKLKQETLNSLQEMYAYCCAYCEGEIESVASGNIEHFKPKTKYPRTYV